MAFEPGNDFVRKLTDISVIRVQCQFRMFRCLVRIVDSCESFDLTCAGFFVQPLRIPRFTGFQRSVDLDFNVLAGIELCADLIAIGFVRGNECCQREQSGVSEELCDFTDAADIFSAIFS